MLEALAAASAETRMGISEIAAAIGVDQPRASRLVNDAAERGLVDRAADPRDARRSVVTITEAGRTAIEGARSSRRTAVTEALAAFTDAERTQFADLLSRFAAAWPR
jgi:DNA-binding MarR family transcriptional regulator